MSSDASRVRIRFVFSVVCLVALALVGRLYFVQIVNGKEFAERTDRQYQKPQFDTFDRGSIFFSDKTGEHISAATLGSGFILAINPTVLEDPQGVFARISTYVTLDQSAFLEKAAKKSDPYEELARRVDPTAANAIARLDIPGVGLYKEQWRLYPGNTLAANTVGFVGSNGEDLVGQYGLERQYEQTLQRKSTDIYANFFAEIFGSVHDAIQAENNKGEEDIVTTIDPNVQDFLERTLADVARDESPRQLGGMVMDPMTGAIYAMAALPTYDPNAYGDVADPHVFLNPLVQGVYELGSIMKPITMASGIDAGVVTPETTYNDRGFVEANGATVWNYDHKGRGPNTSMQLVLGNSLNTGAAFVEQRLGNERFTQYFKNFGLGEATGIDLPGELSGHIDNLETSRDIEHITAAYGQGIAITPIEMVRALSVLANGGVLVTPHVVSSIQYTNGIVKELSYPPGRRVIRPETSETITRMLVSVVDNYLLGGTVKKPNYAIAAKTGTAQVADPATGKYSEDRFLHSFFGYLPAYQPRFIVFFFALEPHGVPFASGTFTNPFMKTADFLINYYEIAPDRHPVS